jgi:flagellar M-ring protein FliF
MPELNPIVSQFLNLLKSMPLSKKISMGFVLVLVITGFALMFFWANEKEYHVLFNNLSQKDGGAIVTKLKEKNIPYRVEANGSMILVPAEKVYELRLTLAGEGLPREGNIGFEIFDQTDFRTTKFVQELNYRRALQGELARTINQFREVNASRVFIVIPKDSLFIEEKMPASASIQLDLRSSLAPTKLAAIVHLVANAVEGLDSGQITVVDTKGRLIFKGANKEDTANLMSNSQLDYKCKIENEIRENIRSMLEGIVGHGKAIVRVTAEIDYNKITRHEEEYDPSATAVRSKRNIEESSRSGQGSGETDQTIISRRSGIVPSSRDNQQSRSKKDIATNYEINKITRTILKPAGTIKRLSVAAVIDGTYELEQLKDGTSKNVYVPRSEEELVKFEEIVKKAMGYNEDREDQVSVNCIEFSGTAPENSMVTMGNDKLDLLALVGRYRKVIVNLLLMVMVFLLIVRPLIKSMKGAIKAVGPEKKGIPAGSGEFTQIPEIKKLSPKERVIEVTKNNPDKTQQLLNGWIGE